MRNFRELRVWNEAMSIVKSTYEIAAMLPDDERFGLRSQISRAAVSIPSNIAEGSAKSSHKELKHYCEISMGSSFELETQLLLIKELNLIKDTIGIDKILVKVEQFQKMLNKFITTLKSRITTNRPKPNT
jgi:four helix bundle protein